MVTRESQITLDTFDEDAYFDKMVTRGENHGMEGEKLLEWASAKVDAFRARLEEKDAKETRLKEEKEEREARLKEEKEEREARLREEREERERQRNHELELARLQARTPDSGVSSNGGQPRERAPPMQKYEDDGKQPLDTYIRSFESLVIANDGTEAEKIRWLLASMPPRLIALINELDSAQLKDYEKVKGTLLASQNFSPAECRARFVSAFPLKEENCSTFGSRKARLFNDWLQVAKCPDDKVVPFLIFDAIANDLPTDVLAYVRTQLKDEVNLDKSLAAVDEYLQHNQPGVRLCDIMRARRSDPKARSQQSAISHPAGHASHHGKGEGKKHHKGYAKHVGKPVSPPRTSIPSSSQVPSPKKDNSGKPKFRHYRGNGKYQSAPSQGVQPYSNSHHSSHRGGQHHHLATRSANAVEARPERACDNNVEDRYEAATVQFTEINDPQLVPKCPGTVNGVAAEIALDTGASGIFVDKRFVKEEDYTGQVVRLRVADGEPQLRRCCVIDLECKYYTGRAPAVALIKPLHPVLLGRVTNLAPVFQADLYNEDITRWNTPLVKSPPATPAATSGYDAMNLDKVPTDFAGPAAVSTRNVERGEFPPPLPDDAPLEPLKSRPDFAKLQQDCPSLKSWMARAAEGKTFTVRGGGQVTFALEDGVLRRHVTQDGHTVKQLVVPASLRRQAMYVAHHLPLSGHRGKAKTRRILQKAFAWPRMYTEIDRYVDSCPVCQSTSTAPVPKVPMGITKLSTEPFAKVAIDILGPINPASSRGKQFLLVYVDLATRYPDAVPLSSITTEAVAQALFEICSRVGFPEQVTSDNGSQFTSRHFEAFCNLLEMKHIRTSVYHAQSNGVCERYNGTLKRCLRKLVVDIPRQWDKYVPAALFSFRDTPHETTGYSPFELIYGHKVRGPVEFLAECWNSPTIEDDDRDVHDYILRFSSHLKKAWKAAHVAIKGQQQSAKLLFDKRARRRALTPGDRALLLLPTDTRKLMLRWKGPYTVVHRVTPDHYVLDVDGCNRQYHINQLKLYRENPEAHRDPALALSDASGSASTSEAATTQVLHYSHPLPPTLGYSSLEVETDLREWSFSEEAPLAAATALAMEDVQIPFDDGKDPAIPTHRKENVSDCVINPKLQPDQREQLNKVLEGHESVFNDLPGVTTTAEHHVRLTDSEPFRHSYGLPHQLSLQLKEDLDTWVRLGIVEKSNSPWCSPLLAVRKRDGSHRFCLDCRQLNSRTIFDGEPIADAEHIFSSLSKARYLSKMDLASGFWQVPLSETTKPLTAFSTRYGLYQFRVMPFGMVNAPGCFSRLMRTVLQGLDNVSCFIDDILVHSQDWSSHLLTLRKVLERLAEHGLHLKPSKCEIGFNQLQYLGHMVGEGVMSPVQDKVQAIKDMEKPSTVTQLRSFLGSVGYYQRFVPHFNSIAAPLQQMTSSKRGKNSPVTWTDEAERAFIKLKEALAGAPVLQLVKPDLPFILQTDASDQGLGAVLLQARSDNPTEVAPVRYASRKLRAAEQNYSTVEKEALAAYWAIKKFEVYLYGRHFVLRSDHRPLLYLQTADKLNPRLKRWALYMSLFKFTAQHVDGETNHLADLLSRRSLPITEEATAASLSLVSLP